MAAASMDGGWRGTRRHTGRTPRRWPAAVAAVLVIAAARTVAGGAHGEDVHRAAAACGTCHTADAATLKRDAAAAALVPDLEARCAGCHDEGPSHRTGVRPIRSPPATLPLAADGTIGCATCHYMHAENDAFGDFLRLDNREGALCLSCHDLTDLR